MDNSKDAIKLIKNNLNLISGIEDRYKIINRDAIKFLSNFSDFVFDYIFLDPPFKIDSRIMTEIFNILHNSRIIDENSVIIYEFFFKRDVEQELGNFKIFKTSRFGEKKVVYLSKS